MASAGNGDNVTVKPLVKHVLSKELQLYFERVCTAITDEGSGHLRTAALASIRNDPGLHQLLPYFIQFISEKTTHGLKNLFILTTMMELTHALLENPHIFVEPYVLTAP
jgi:transcription initiation factor TFIID subunit 6